MRALSLVAVLLLTGCYGSHGLPSASADAADAGPGSDAAPSDATTGAPVAPPRDGPVRCGPNTCLAGEICCDAVCGACTLPAECVDYECRVGP